MVIFFAILLITVLLASWLLTVFGMPGNWLIVLATAIYSYCLPAKWAVSLGWKILVILAVLAALGELLELLAGAAGTTKAGGSKRGAALALLGSIIGSVVGVIVGIPIPLVGPILAALFFAAIGATAGAMLGEAWVGKDLNASWQIGKAAFWGRLIGTMSKLLIGAVMVAFVVVSLIM
jgi:uncharacterized protein